MELIDKVAEALDDSGILYGDLVDNGDSTIRIVGVDEDEWDDVVAAIEDCLGLNVSVPPEGHDEMDDELVVLGYGHGDGDDGLPKIPDSYDLDVLRKIKDMVPNDAFAYIKSNHGGNKDLAMMYLDYAGYGEDPRMQSMLKSAIGESLQEARKDKVSFELPWEQYLLLKGAIAGALKNELANDNESKFNRIAELERAIDAQANAKKEELHEDEEEPKLETFDEKMDFLAKDEQEAIDGYDKVIAMLNPDEDATAIEQLTKIKVEEEAHKKFLEDVKGDHGLVYTEPLEPEEVIDEGKTASQRYNDRMSKIFDRADKANLAMKAFLIKNGVSEEEAEELYKNTGLHGNPLHQKMIDMGIADDFFSKYDYSKGTLEESKETFEVGDEWDWQDGGFVVIKKIDDGKYLMGFLDGSEKWVSEEELIDIISTGRKVIDGKNPFPDADSIYESHDRVEYLVLTKDSNEMEWFDDIEKALEYAEGHEDAGEVIEIHSRELDSGEREYLDDQEQTVWLSEGGNFRGLAFYEYPKGSGFHVRETPSAFVALDDHGTTLGDSKTKAGAEAIIDDRLKGSVNEELTKDMWDRLSALDADFHYATDEDGKRFIIVEGWDDVQKIQKALDPNFEPHDEYDASLLDEATEGRWGFSDEYSSCDECEHLIRTSPNSYSWTPDFFADYEGGRIVCGDCVRKNPEDYLASLYNNPKKANTILSRTELEEQGFQRIGDDYQAGWYDRNDRPEKILGKALEEHPNATFIFSIASQGQFATNFELWGADLGIDERLSEGRHAELDRLLAKKRKELAELSKRRKRCKSEGEWEEIQDRIDSLMVEIGDIEGEVAEIRFLDNGDPSDFSGFESIGEGVSTKDPSLKKGIAFLNRNRKYFGYICSYLDARTHQRVAVDKGFKTERELLDHVAKIEGNKGVTDVSVIRQGEQEKYMDALEDER